MYIIEDYFKKLEEIGAIPGAVVGAGTGVFLGASRKWAISKEIKRLKRELETTGDSDKKSSLQDRIKRLENKKDGIIKKGAKKGAVVGAVVGGVAGYSRFRKGVKSGKIKIPRKKIKDLLKKRKQKK